MGGLKIEVLLSKQKLSLTCLTGLKVNMQLGLYVNMVKLRQTYKYLALTSALHCMSRHSDLVIMVIFMLIQRLHEKVFIYGFKLFFSSLTYNLHLLNPTSNNATGEGVSNFFKI